MGFGNTIKPQGLEPFQFPTKIGTLSALASSTFDVFVTVDRNLTFQQNLTHLEIAVIVLVAGGNRLVDLEPLVQSLLKAIGTIERGQVVRVDV
jgi:hypothetical protein